MRKLLICFAALATGACAGTQSHLRLLEKDNALNVQPAPPGLPYDFVVSIRNVKDFGFDPDDKATRDRTALQALQSQCPAGRIVGETAINTGAYALGNASLTYSLQVKCS
jgi:hypothetical protein